VGRPISRTRVPLLSLLVPAACAVGVLGCAAREGPPHGIAAMWREYEKMPDERAFAVAGDPARIWVGAIGGGYATREIAEESVLALCVQRRGLRRLQDPCRLYATGDEIVW